MLVGGDRVDAVIFLHDLTDGDNSVAVEINYLRPRMMGMRKPFIFSTYRLAYLVSRGLVGNGLIITNSNVSDRDISFSRELGIGVVIIEDAREELRNTDFRERVLSALPRQQGKAEAPVSSLVVATEGREPKKRIFVALQFSARNEDLFNYGISAVAEQLSMEAYRSLEVEHNEVIIDVIQRSIKNADWVIAELSDDNQNVYYEVGYAHALGKPTILCARKGTHVRFDLAAINCIFYENITELSGLLKRRLASMYDENCT